MVTYTGYAIVGVVIVFVVAEEILSYIHLGPGSEHKAKQRAIREDPNVFREDIENSLEAEHRYELLLIYKGFAVAFASLF